MDSSPCTQSSACRSATHATRLWRLPIVTLLLPVAIRLLLLPIAVWLLLLLAIPIRPLLLLLHHHCNQALPTLTRGVKPS